MHDSSSRCIILEPKIKTGFEKIKVDVVSCGLVVYTTILFFCSNCFRNSMQTYFALGLINTHTLSQTLQSGGFEKSWPKKKMFGGGDGGSG